MSDLHHDEQLDMEQELLKALHAADTPTSDKGEEEFELEDILAEFSGYTAPTSFTEKKEPEKETSEPSVPAAEDEDADIRIAQPRTKEKTDSDWREITKDLPELPHQPREKKILRFPSVFADVVHRATEAKQQSPAQPTEPAPSVDDPPLMRLEEVMSQTVDSVLEENDDALLEEPVSIQEHLERAKKAAVEGWQRLEKACRKAEPDPWTEPEEEKDETAEPEPDLEMVSREARRSCKRMRRQLLLCALPVLALLVLTVLDTWFASTLPALWREDARIRCGTMAGLLFLAAAVVPALWQGALKDIREHRISCAAAAFLSAVVSLADAIMGIFTRTEYLPLAASPALFLWLCLFARLQTADMHRRMYRLADLGGVPPYGLSMTAAGICKQRGRLDGFYRTAQISDPGQKTEQVLLPLLITACTVCSGVVCLNGRMGEFFRVWSAMLSASLALSLPLVTILPLHLLNARLGRSGAAVAGWAGAKAISKAKRMVLTDSDLFPAGTVSLNGLKIYGEEVGKVVSYAATIARASESPLCPIFDQLLAGEGGTVQEVGQVRYYEEGGVEGLIHGEYVVMGSAYCMKKLHVTLPRELKVKTGVFLAVDGQLIAIFAIKYQPSRNVEWALRALRRNHVSLVLGTRSANITPGLLKRKFGLDVKPVYPSISTRLSLSDLIHDRVPQADGLLYREGLMPYAEMVIGSRRCCRVVNITTTFATFSSLAGLLLSYYLTNSAAYAAMGSGYVLLFLALLLLPVWLLAGLVKIY